MATGGIPDLDNVLKPTFDALEGLAFTDDAQLSDIHAARVDLNSLSHDRSLAADCESWPATLIGHVEVAKNLKEFVYIQIVDSSNLLEVPWLPQH
ncbi:RusA family crossover junction endodeoxyribonuclease [Candidatus Poriferisodalis sp.]|uniref:RusA family crossover junction endodeoxyribonuclease n=1 Tax=Candidatus Poriferisodalis sp. TaxID=3101277 RepID=UPI003B0248D7